MTDAQMTQIAVEEWSIDSPNAQTTQVAIEQWNIDTPTGLMTQIAIEQWASVAGAALFSARHV